MKILIINLVFILLLCNSGCNNNSDTIQPVVNSHYIKELVLRSISGDSLSNKILSNIVDLNIPVNKNYNKLMVDSILSKGKTFYYIILEYPNPAYNRFAVYDKDLNLYLLDKSLNGGLSDGLNFGTIIIDGVLFGKIVENFLSRDVVVKRLSLYKFGENSVSLSLRTFTSFNSSNLWITQGIKSFQKDTIITFTTNSARIKNIAAGDTFIFKPSKNMFIRNNNTFSNYIINELKKIKADPGISEIVDEKSLKASFGAY